MLLTGMLRIRLEIIFYGVGGKGIPLEQPDQAFLRRESLEKESEHLAALVEVAGDRADAQRGQAEKAEEGPLDELADAPRASLPTTTLSAV